jgi:type II secretory ATPase GspE/PulE/Tfp pilus assembly ATPase PilB-like protein/ActR/RegA family two-component response regulator
MATRVIRDEWLLPTLEPLVDGAGLAELRDSTEWLWDGAVRRGLTTDTIILSALSTRFKMAIADLSMVSAAARDLVPEALARRYRVIPLSVSDTTLDIATADPNDLDCERTLAFVTGKTVRMMLASPSAILQRLDELYQPENTVDKLLEGMGSHDIQSISESGDDLADFALGSEKASARPIIRLVDHIIAEAIAQRASDVHLELQEAGVQVNYRIDGVLRSAMSLPRAVGVPLVSRIKIMSGLDITDRLRPQDGRARVAVNGNRIDLRISTLPASTGEKVVIRILDATTNVLSLESLGVVGEDLAIVKELMNLREGIVLVTGPTGSGKTTTLYAALRNIQAKGVNIVTVEDPVEYKLKGIVQVQVNEKAGMTFAAALRSILRQDPDVVLVGEIRDRETASIAIQAALTGHLVLSTLHTIDAATSIARLLDIGVESYKIGAALKGVVAQRLVRRLCSSCKQPSDDTLAPRLRQWIPEGSTIYKAVGCLDCGHTGYRGRHAIMEVLSSDAEVERRISAGESPERIAEAARENGMRSLWESGINHVLKGDTDLDELARVVEVPTDGGGRRRGQSALEPIPRPTPRHARQVRAHPNSGSTPAVGAAPAPAARPSVLPSEALELVDDAEPGSMTGNGQTILLVEDETHLRAVMKDILERDGFRVIEAADGIEALDEIDHRAPDVVLLDLSLPRLDGFGVLSRLRSRLQTSSIPVVVLTARGDEENEVKVFESGADDFLTKPFRARALTARIKALLRRV